MKSIFFIKDDIDAEDNEMYGNILEQKRHEVLKSNYSVELIIFVHRKTHMYRVPYARRYHYRHHRRMKLWIWPFGVVCRQLRMNMLLSNPRRK